MIVYPDIWVEIYKHLSLIDIIKLSKSSKKLYVIYKNNKHHIYKNLLSTELKLEYPETVKNFYTIDKKLSLSSDNLIKACTYGYIDLVKYFIISKKIKIDDSCLAFIAVEMK
jgi:hypothetical protein